MSMISHDPDDYLVVIRTYVGRQSPIWISLCSLYWKSFAEEALGKYSRPGAISVRDVDEGNGQIV